METSFHSHHLGQWVILLFLGDDNRLTALVDGHVRLRFQSPSISLFLLSLCSDCADIVRVTDVEDLASVPCLFLEQNEPRVMVIAWCSNKHLRVNLSDEESLGRMEVLILLLLHSTLKGCAVIFDIIELGHAKGRRPEMLHVLEWS